MNALLILGRKYRDVVSGWEGVATARYEYLNGCVRYEIAGADKDGKPESFIFDVEQLVAVDAPPVVTAPASPTGGPRSSKPVAR